MKVVYDSLTGKVKKFVSKLNVDALKIEEGLIVDEPFCLITYTIGFGEVPPSTSRFLEMNHSHLLGVASSGNKVWGDRFANAANIISSQYEVPIVHKFEVAGMESDVATVLDFIQGYAPCCSESISVDLSR